MSIKKKKIQTTKQETINMYRDSKKQWNAIVGCEFDCVYCTRSFQAQMKRRKPQFNEEGEQTRGCQKCYDYTPHFHANRLKDPLPNTSGDEFIWACSSCDIRFADPKWIEKVIQRMSQLPYKQFFMQSKDSTVFQEHQIPPNCWIGITLETNRDQGYEQISKAPIPSKRIENALKVKIDIITIEPIMDFDLEEFKEIIRQLKPMRVYIGYDTKKCHLPEPDLAKTLQLIADLSKFTIVKPKLLREKWNSESSVIGDIRPNKRKTEKERLDWLKQKL